MKPRTLIALGLVICGLQAPTIASETDARQAATLQNAHEQYEVGHYAEAYSRFAHLADCGNREAARIALQMRQFGPQLYGTTFSAGPKQLWRWKELLAKDTAVPVDAACVMPEVPRARAVKPLAPPASAPRSAGEAIDTPSEYWRHHGVG